MIGPLVVIDAGRCQHLDLTELLGTARLVFAPVQPASTTLHRRRASWDGRSPTAWGVVAVTVMARRTSRGVRDARVISDPRRSLRFDCAQSSPCGLLLWLIWRRAGLVPATASPTFFPGVCHAFLANQEARLPPSSAALRPHGCRSAVRRLKTATEAAWGGSGEQSGDTTMAQIGTFTRNEDGSFNGTIRTININTKATIKPVAKEGERSPDYRVAASGVELGAGWSKTAKDSGVEYVSIKLDDPSFTAPVYATLVQGDKGEHKLIWSR
jgi:uncharacterized protein (DUF736 family)